MESEQPHEKEEDPGHWITLKYDAQRCQFYDLFNSMNRWNHELRRVRLISWDVEEKNMAWFDFFVLQTVQLPF